MKIAVNLNGIGNTAGYICAIVAGNATAIDSVTAHPSLAMEKFRCVAESCGRSHPDNC